MSRVGPIGRTTTRILSDAVGFALCQALVAQEPNPRFDNSAVDGYAVGHASDALVGSRLKVAGIAAAGGNGLNSILVGEARRIFTGAQVPLGTYGIIMQEDVLSDGETIALQHTIREGEHIRRIGADFGAGDELLPTGTSIEAGSSALLAFAGASLVEVYDALNISVITTGDELVDPSEFPAGSQIRDTNGVMLINQVLGSVRANLKSLRLKDDRALMIRALLEESATQDVIIVAGGASVGDRDYLRPCMDELGQVHIHGVSIRPGKPFLFGTIGDCLVFGLPGNPASAYVCFEAFVRDALRKLAGWQTPTTKWVRVKLGFDHQAIGREDFVRVSYVDGVVHRCSEQGSFGLISVARADGLARLPADLDLRQGDDCLVLWLRR